MPDEIASGKLASRHADHRPARQGSDTHLSKVRIDRSLLLESFAHLCESFRNPTLRSLSPVVKG